LCNQLCRKLHDHDRSGEVEDGIAKTAAVVERHGGITGYASAIGLFAHAVGETDEDLMALIRCRTAITGPGILVPTGNHARFSRCLENGLSLVFQMMLMTTGR
jgi:hypothetical protein